MERTAWPMLVREGPASSAPAMGSRESRGRAADVFERGNAPDTDVCYDGVGGSSGIASARAESAIFTKLRWRDDVTALPHIGPRFAQYQRVIGEIKVSSWRISRSCLSSSSSMRYRNCKVRKRKVINACWLAVGCSAVKPAAKVCFSSLDSIVF